ncbi:V-type ATP synthase subunit E family protein [Sphaerochaeta sp.]|uniref:V-type ATP synthase subunit E family protein n=1 Tax=Sphaerochaeta sp. TaxID=1972642 RepID=UPI0025898826|nr:V-type ATP synthase subunit E family protein [Sphaerochaeta sp.]MDD3456696.1 V-type ATP synthase subunit E family protein [Sphaerochaeta sp.]
METTDSRLLTGILEQAEQSAKKTLQEAKQQASAIVGDAKKKAESEMEGLRRELAQKLKQMDLRLQANMTSAKRKAILRQGDEKYQQVLARVQSMLDAKTIEPYLPQWIAEAALGLDLKEAKVASSPQCPVTETHLKTASELVEKATGSSIVLHLESKPIRGLGVVVSSLDGMVSFNNQVEIRLRRLDRVLRAMIQEHT